MMKINVLSVFDGVSGGMIALERAGITVKNYYASEIDKYASKVSETMYPDIIRLGDVTKWQEWDLPQIDLLIGGSPCQSFSFAGRRNGMSTGDIEVTSLKQYKQLKADGVQFDGQSYLFWEYVAILRHYKPKWFLLENVKMSKQWEAIITRELGINPVMINSALVSAQNRKRLYWTNINAKYNLLGDMVCGIKQPADKGIMLNDILDADAQEPVLSNIYGGFGETKPREHFGKSVTIRANSGGGSIPSVRKKSKTLRVGGRGSLDRHEWDSVDDLHTRKLSVTECARLQTLPDNFVEVARSVGISDTQLYKMIGNGWTIDVIVHLLSYLKEEALI